MGGISTLQGRNKLKMNTDSTMRVKLYFPLLLILLSGCATTGEYNNVIPSETLLKAEKEVRESQLLDVDITLFDPGELPEDEEKSRGLSMEIRKAEARFIPIHLRAVMEKTGFWGAVRVVPEKSEGFELLVRGTIIASDGEILELNVEALDARGQSWYSRNYRGVTAAADYTRINTGADGFQTVYRAIANDLAQFRNNLSDDERTAIRRIADMRFAANMAPDAFSEHIRQDEITGRYQLVRLPAKDDPAYQRVEGIRERDFLLIDTLNGHYENYYRDMRTPYEEWRKARSIEAEALREVKKKANTSKALGVAAILAAIAIEATGGSSTRAATGTLRDVMVIGGAYSIKRGMDINAQSTLHEEEISELGDSFSAEAEPMVVEVDGEIHKLTGSAEAQYAQWRGLMRKIYASETGLMPLGKEATLEPATDNLPVTTPEESVIQP
jgi:hypothetical protein